MTDERNPPEGTPAGDDSTTARQTRRRLPPLPFGVRLLLLIVGGILGLVGIAGLFLPGLQGILTLMLGAAVLSLASDRVYSFLRRLFGRWPKVHGPMEEFREKAHGWLSGTKGGTEDEATEDE